MAFVSQFTGPSLPSQRRRPRSSICPSSLSSAPGILSRMQTPFAEHETNDNSKPTTPGDVTQQEPWQTGKIRAPRQIRGGGRRRRGYIRSQGHTYTSRSPPPNPPGLRVAAGVARGRRILSPNVYLRPMMAKVREALFTMLELLDVLREDGTVLDLFAGSGSVGIEALSRGMARAVFVDFSQDCVETINRNLDNCLMQDQGQAVCARVEEFVANGSAYNGGRHYDLITITPPYEEVNYAELVSAVANSNCVGEGTFVVVEYPVEMSSIPPAIGHRLVGIRNRRYGRTVIAVYACQPDVDVDRRPEEFIDARRG